MKNIGFLLLLFFLSLKVSAALPPREAFSQAGSTSVAVAPVEDNDPYKGESGFIRQVVYIDLPGEHLPLSPKDYRTWIMMGGLIFISLLAMYIMIRGKTRIDQLNKEYGAGFKPL